VFLHRGLLQNRRVVVTGTSLRQTSSRLFPALGGTRGWCLADGAVLLPTWHERVEPEIKAGA
jgi:hypothetical protein